MLEKMKEIIAEQLSVDADSITEASSFKDDLGADSLDLFELVMALEDEYSVEIPAEDLLGMIHYNTEVIDADRQGKSPYDFSETVTAEIRKIKDKIDQNSIL